MHCWWDSQLFARHQGVSRLGNPGFSSRAVHSSTCRSFHLVFPARSLSPFAPIMPTLTCSSPVPGTDKTAEAPISQPPAHGRRKNRRESPAQTLQPKDQSGVLLPASTSQAQSGFQWPRTQPDSSYQPQRQWNNVFPLHLLLWPKARVLLHSKEVLVLLSKHFKQGRTSVGSPFLDTAQPLLADSF